MHTFRPLCAVVFAASGMAFAVACEDESSSDPAAPDGGRITLDGGPSTSPDSAPPPPPPPEADGGNEDASDGSVYGTGVGLRVKFLGAEQAFGGDDESSLNDLLKADTTLTPTRSLTIATLDAAFLADADIIVLDLLPRSFTGVEAQALYDWVRAGHGLIVLSGYGAGTDPRTDSLLGPFGLTYGGGYPSAPGYVATIPGHPVVDGVSGLRFYGGQFVTSALDASVSFAKYNDASIGVATPFEKGRVVMFGDEWILLDVEVNRTDDAGAFPTRRFWHNAFLWAGGRID